MGDWSTDPLAAAIERRRGRRAAYARDAHSEEDRETARAERCVPDWSEEDWARAVERHEGGKARYRTSERYVEHAPEGVIDVAVHVFDLIGHERAWRAYAWARTQPDGTQAPRTRLHGPHIHDLGDVLRRPRR